MIFKGRDFHVKNSFITVNNVPLKNTNKAVHLCHSLSTDDDDSIVTAAIAQFWRSLTYFLLILDTFRPICNVNFLNNTVTVFMVLHCGFYLVTLSIRFVLHGGKL